MTEVKQIDPNKTKVEVMDPELRVKETKEEKPSVLKRGLNASGRCCTALKSIFASIGSMLMGKRRPHWLAKITAGFLTILGWLFFSVAFTPALASGVCEVGAERLMEVKVETEGETCSEESSLP